MVATIQALLCGPCLRDDWGGRVLLAPAQRRADKRPMPIVPSRFDEHTPQVSISRFGDRATRLFRAARMLGGHETDKRHRTRRRREPTGIAEFGRNRQRGEIVNAPQTSQPFDARRRGSRESSPRSSFSTLRSRATASSTVRKYAAWV